MPEVKLPEATFSWDNILFAVALLVAACGVIVAIVKGIEAWKKISVRDRVKALEDEVAKINHRLEIGNKRFKAQGEDMGQILQTLSALQVHFITGNDHEKLRQSNDQLVAYMNRRAQRDAEEV